jgi:hypothetical protein
LNSDDLKIVQESLLTIASLMEIHTWRLSIEDRKKRFDYLYDQNILKLELNDFELKECVERICRVLYPLLKGGYDFKKSDHFTNVSITFTMLRALEESPSRIALEPSLHLFSSCYRFMNDQACSWLISTLSELILVSNDLTEYEKKSILENTSILEILSDKMSILNSESDNLYIANDLKQTITFLIEGIEDLMTTG